MSEVIHLIEKQCFIVELIGEPAVLKYKILSQDNIDFTNTFVPFRARGKGFAEALVKEGLSWAKQQDFNIQASCWYVDKFLKDD